MSDKRPETKKQISLKGLLMPSRLIPLGFLLVIIIGTFLLALPVASATGKSIGVFKALFTATSAVCVTGLTVVETGLAFSTLGQIVLMLLIQVGGLGFVSIMTLISVFLGRRITLSQRMLIREAMNENNIGGMVKLIIWVVKMTLMCELAGACLLAIRFVGDFGVGRGIYYAIFHSVSAFCNAGFDLLGEGVSISRYVGDPVVSLTVALLVITGGLGFGVVHDVLTVRRFKKLRLHTKLILVVTGILLACGTGLILLTEWNNPATIGNMSIPGKVMAAFFQSVTFRTAGFFTVNQLELEPATKLLGIALMFIGAAPASTGGGMKASTVAILVLLTVSIIRGKKEPTLFGRTIPKDTIRRATAIVLTGLVVFVCASFAVSALHPEFALVDIMYECVSALCTVGLTAAGTANYCIAAQLIIILLMYMGRIGPLTLTLALAMRQQNATSAIRLPEEQITVG